MADNNQNTQDNSADGNSEEITGKINIENNLEVKNNGSVQNSENSVDDTELLEALKNIQNDDNQEFVIDIANKRVGEGNKSGSKNEQKILNELGSLLNKLTSKTKNRNAKDKSSSKPNTKNSTESKDSSPVQQNDNATTPNIQVNIKKDTGNLKKNIEIESHLESQKQHVPPSDNNKSTNQEDPFKGQVSAKPIEENNSIELEGDIKATDQEYSSLSKPIQKVSNKDLEKRLEESKGDDEKKAIQNKLQKQDHNSKTPDQTSKELSNPGQENSDENSPTKEEQKPKEDSDSDNAQDLNSNTPQPQNKKGEEDSSPQQDLDGIKHKPNEHKDKYKDDNEDQGHEPRQPSPEKNLKDRAKDKIKDKAEKEIKDKVKKAVITTILTSPIFWWFIVGIFIFFLIISPLLAVYSCIDNLDLSCVGINESPLSDFFNDPEQENVVDKLKPTKNEGVSAESTEIAVEKIIFKQLGL